MTCNHSPTVRVWEATNGQCPLCLAAENAALRQRNEQLRSANEWVELESERDALRARLVEVEKFLEPAGWQKAQDERNALRARLAEAEATIAATPLLPSIDRIEDTERRLAEAETLLREAHDNHWPFMSRNDLADRIGTFLTPADQPTGVVK